PGARTAEVESTSCLQADADRLGQRFSGPAFCGQTLPGQDQQIADFKDPGLVCGAGRPPGGVARKVGLGILTHDLDEDLGNDAATHCAETVAAALNRRLSQEVQP